MKNKYFLSMGNLSVKQSCFCRSLWLFVLSVAMFVAGSNVLRAQTTPDEEIYSCNGMTVTVLNNGGRETPINYGGKPDTMIDIGFPGHYWVKISFVFDDTTHVDEVEACNQYTWMSRDEGKKYRDFTYQDLDGFYYDTFSIEIKNAPSYAFYGRDPSMTSCQVVHYDGLKLHIVKQDSLIDVQSACDSFKWKYNNNTYTSTTKGVVEAQKAYYPEPSTYPAFRCDSVITLNLTVIDESSRSDTRNDTACNNYTWHHKNGTDTSFTESGIVTVRDSGAAVYTTTTTPALEQGTLKCDSIHKLNLMVYKSHNVDSVYTACDSFAWNGQTYRESVLTREDARQQGAYRFISTNKASDPDVYMCNDTTFLQLSIDTTKHGYDTLAACDEYVWDKSLPGFKHPDQTTFRVAADSSLLDIVVTDTIVRNYNNRCDSVVSLQLYIHNSGCVTDSVSNQCGSYTWIDGVTYNSDQVASDITEESGRNNFSHQGVTNGVTYCDTVHVLHLEIDPIYDNPDTDIAVCDSLSIRYYKESDKDRQDTSLGINHTFKSSMTAYQKYHFKTARFACDSSRRIKVTVHQSKYADTNVSYPASLNKPYDDGKGLGVKPGFVWNGRPYFKTGDYKSQKGDYYTMYGCDSIITMHFKARHSYDSIMEQSVECDSVKHSGTYYYKDTMLFVGVKPDPREDNSAVDTILWHQIRVNHRHDSVLRMDVCDSFRWNVTRSLYQADTTVRIDYRNGTPTHALNGCDSSVSVVLHVRHSSYNTLSTEEKCFPGTWDKTGAVQYTRPIDTGYWHVPLELNADGCDSFLVQPMTVHPSYYERDTINACDAFTIPGNWTVDGNIKWGPGNSEKFTQTTGTPSNPDPNYLGIRTIHGCDSFIYHHIVIFHSDTLGTETVKACEQYTWSGFGTSGRDTTFHISSSAYSEVYTMPKEYFREGTVTGVYDTAGLPLHCDSARALHLVLYHNGRDTVQYVKCDSMKWNMNNRVYFESDTDEAVTPWVCNREGSSFRCDSITTMLLTINYSTVIDFDTTACDRFIWSANNVTYRESTTDTKKLEDKNSVGCDSALRMNLKILPSTKGDLDTSVCDSLHWSNGITYTANTNRSFPPKDTLHHVNQYGCDSIVSLYLTVKQSTHVAIDTAVCDSFLWDMKVDDHTGMAPKHYVHAIGFGTDTVHGGVNEDGCDSIFDLNLTIHKSNLNGRDSITACDTFVWEDGDGHEYTSTPAPGTYPHYTGLKTIHGCDSAVTLYLTINRRTADTTDLGVDTVCGSGSWRGHPYHERVVANGELDTVWTIYHADTNSVGCDSVVMVNLSVMPNPIIIDTPVYPEGQTYFCDTMHWHDTVIAESGSHSLAVPNESGICDNIYKISVNIRQSTFVDAFDTVCQDYYWSLTDSTYTASFDTTYRLSMPQFNGVGCYNYQHKRVVIMDSIVRHDTVYRCDNYSWDNLPLSLNSWAVGLAPYTETDTVWRGTFVSKTGCDSIVYQHVFLFHSDTVISVEGACDSFWWEIDSTWYFNSGKYTAGPFYAESPYRNCSYYNQLRLTINKHDTIDDTIHACEPIRWNGRTYSENSLGLVYQKFSRGSQYGCDSTSRLVLYMHEHKYGVDAYEVCNHLVWRDGNDYTQSYSGNATSPTFRDTGKAAYGCDSIYRLQLVLKARNVVRFDTTVCDFYKWWNNKTYTATSYGDQYESAERGGFDPVTNCDTLYVLNLKVNYGTHNSQYVHACDSFYWATTKQWYYRGRSGIHLGINNCYSDPYYNVYGCRSLDTLHLDLGRSDNLVDEIPGSRCDSFRWERNGKLYTQSTDSAYFMRTNMTGCDSSYRLVVFITHSTVNTAYLDGCDSVEYPIFSDRFYLRDTVMDKQVGKNDEFCPIIRRTVLTVHPSYDYTETLVVCDSIRWNDSTYFRSTDTSTFYGHTSTIRKDNQAVSNCDSIVHLNLMVNYGRMTVWNVTECDQYPWRGNIYTSDTVVSQVFDHTSEGCNIGDVLRLKVNHTTYHYDTLMGCEQYMWEGHGVLTHSIDTAFLSGELNQVGCDSIDSLHIEIKHHPIGSTEVLSDICGHYTWPFNNKTYYATGVYHDTLPDCGTINTIDLTIKPEGLHIDSVPECDFYTWPRNLVQYSSDTIVTIRLPQDMANGCPDSARLVLTMKYSSSSTFDTSVCDEYVWHGHRLTRDTVVEHVTTAANHCDSVVTLTLAVHKSSYSTQTAIECDRFVWHDSVFTASGFPQWRRTNSRGCDSIITLNLTIHYSDTVDYYDTACNQFAWNGTTIYASDVLTRWTINDSACNRLERHNVTIGRDYSVLDKRIECDSLRWLDGQLYLRSTSSPVYHGTTQYHCDSIVRLNLTLNHSSSAVISKQNCGSYTWHGSVYTSSSDTIMWHTRNHKDCDSVVNLHLTIYPAGEFQDTVYACEGYDWEGNHYSTTGNYGPVDLSDQSSHGCDSIVFLHLNIGHMPAVIGRMDTAACTFLRWHGVMFTNDTVFRMDTVTRYGCDSAYNVHVTISNMLDPDTLPAEFACDSFSWRGNTYRMSGLYSDTIQGAVANCYSVTWMPLTIGYSSSSTVNGSYCPGYRWNGFVFTHDVDTTVLLGFNQSGCDSTATLHLLIDSTVLAGEQVEGGCDAYTWNGIVVTADTLIVHTIALAPEQGQCDTVQVVRISILNSSSSVDTHAVCDSLLWIDGVVYTASTTTPVAHLTNAVGCDSSVSLNLTVYHGVSHSFTKVDPVGYEWNGVYYTRTGTYTQHFPQVQGCDSVVTLRLVITDIPQPQLVSTEGRYLMVNHYPNGQGYERVDYAAYRWYHNGTLIPNATSDSYREFANAILKGCYYVEVPIDAAQTTWIASEPYCTTEGIDDVDGSEFTIQLLPNPASQGVPVLLQTSLEEGQQATLLIFDLQGRNVAKQVISSAVTTVNHNLPAGVYMIRLMTTEGSCATQRLIVR
ncbi:MAG: T9SS type A sorting domain-containing protein [Bacteroidales bacterium]|nr:T9SS type A sorting domain-containing protein [Candidatus Colimorpha onthohippi]